VLARRAPARVDGLATAHVTIAFKRVGLETQMPLAVVYGIVMCGTIRRVLGAILVKSASEKVSISKRTPTPSLDFASSVALDGSVVTLHFSGSMTSGNVFLIILHGFSSIKLALGLWFWGFFEKRSTIQRCRHFSGSLDFVTVFVDAPDFLAALLHGLEPFLFAGGLLALGNASVISLWRNRTRQLFHSATLTIESRKFLHRFLDARVGTQRKISIAEALAPGQF